MSQETGSKLTRKEPYYFDNAPSGTRLKLIWIMDYASTNVKLTPQEWISVLKLSTMWEFVDIRERAIQELNLLKGEMGMGSIEKIEYARCFDLKEWLLEGYTELLKRAMTITNDEAERLGWKTAAKLLLLREQYLLTVDPAYTCGGCGGNSCAVPGNLYTACTPRYGGSYLCGKRINEPNRDQHDFTTALRKEFEVEL
jgi:hypothetical protein